MLITFWVNASNIRLWPLFYRRIESQGTIISFKNCSKNQTFEWKILKERISALQYLWILESDLFNDKHSRTTTIFKKYFPIQQLFFFHLATLKPREINSLKLQVKQETVTF